MILTKNNINSINTLIDFCSKSLLIVFQTPTYVLRNRHIQ